MSRRRTGPALPMALLPLALMLGLPLAADPFQQPTRRGATVPQPRSVPFTVGETLAYDVSWASYLTAGTATLTVKEKKPSYGSDAYYVVAEGRPTPLLSRLYDLYYKADSLLDVYTLLPQRASIYSQEGRRRRTKVTLFDHRKGKAHYELQTATLVKADLAIPPGTQDALGLIYALRTRALKPGETFTMPVCDAGESYTVRITVGGVERVKTGIGEVRAWRLTPVLPAAQQARQLTLWISEDARRLPVRMQAQLAVGSFDLTLTSTSR